MVRWSTFYVYRLRCSFRQSSIGCVHARRTTPNVCRHEPRAARASIPILRDNRNRMTHGPLFTVYRLLFTFLRSSPARPINPPARARREEGSGIMVAVNSNLYPVRPLFVL